MENLSTYLLVLSRFKYLFNKGLISKTELNQINENLKAEYKPTFDGLAKINTW